MKNTYSALHHQRIHAGIRLQQPATMSLGRESPACDIMTDLQHSTAYSINATATIQQAHQKMILCGVRLLFVTDNQQQLSGLMTTTDLFGERPLIYLREHGGDREAILVGDIMTPREDIDAINYADVVRANVGDIMETLCETNRQHLLVVDNEYIRGLFSATDISRALGEDIQISGRASNFAELNSALIAH
jgi:signal-transduction protein with cAMP-binding, CBS, and nucleotidyltransferase domain